MTTPMPDFVAATVQLADGRTIPLRLTVSPAMFEIWVAFLVWHHLSDAGDYMHAWEQFRQDCRGITVTSERAEQLRLIPGGSNG